MPIILLSLGVLGLIVLCLFAFPVLSPIPYFPSNKADMSLILRHIGLAQDTTVIDLGAGDGIVVFEAAREARAQGMDTQFIAVEINPVLVLILHIRRLIHPNRANIRIVWGDLFTMDYRRILPDKNIVVYLYVSPWLMEKIIHRLNDQLAQYMLVSYFYPIQKDMKPVAQGVHALYQKKYTNGSVTK